MSTLDPTIVAVSDPSIITFGAIESPLPIVTIPEGQTQSNPFLVSGLQVGKTVLNALTSNPEFPGFPTPIGTWDVNPGADANSTKFLDANPADGPTNCRVSGSAVLSTDPAVLSSCGQPVIGTVTDGASQLLMRLVSGLTGTACYELVSSGPDFPDQGMIPNPVVGTQTVGGLNYAFSFYQAPDVYGDTTGMSRQVQVQFVFTPDSGNGDTTSITANLTVVRPPMMLIHGVWGSAGTWDPMIFITNAPSKVFNADYSSTNGASFTTNLPKIQGFVANTLMLSHQAGYAATKADVVAHSMGGILTRLYAASPQYMRPDNFNRGDIHRFITVDTPHGGSSLASMIVALHAVSPGDTEATIHSVIAADASVTDGAICDLSENSAGLTALTSTNLDSQVITATGVDPGEPDGGKFYGGVVGTVSGGSIEAALTATRCVKSEIVDRTYVCVESEPIFNQTTVNSFRYRQANDAIVPLCSQQGGMGGTVCPAVSSAGFNFPGLIHSSYNLLGYHIVDGVTNSQAVATQIYSLLAGPKSGFSSTLPGTPSDGTGVSVTVPGLGVTQDAANFTSQCKTGTPPPMKTNIAHADRRTGQSPGDSGDSQIQVVTPTNGQVFAPGDTVTATVSIAPALKASSVALAAYGLGEVGGSNYDGSTYQASVTIPMGTAGPLQLVPVVSENGGDPILGLTTTVDIRPKTPPLNLTLSQADDVLTSIGATDRIFVTGNYPGNITSDLTSSASGTTYKSSNTGVVTVDAEGNATAVGFGTAAITVSNMGVMVFETFTVEDPAHPLAPQDVTANVGTSDAGFRVDRTTGFFDQTVQWTNKLAVPVVGPLYFVATGLPAGVTLIGAGKTQNITPTGSPYFTLQLPDGITLQPGASITQVLKFLNPSLTRIAYTSKIFRTLATP